MSTMSLFKSRDRINEQEGGVNEKVLPCSTLVLLGSRKLPLQTSLEVKWEQLTKGEFAIHSL